MKIYIEKGLRNILLIVFILLLYSCDERFFNYMSYSKEQIEEYILENNPEILNYYTLEELLYISRQINGGVAFSGFPYSNDTIHVIEIEKDTLVKLDLLVDQKGLGGCVAADQYQFSLDSLECNLKNSNCLKQYFSLKEDHNWDNILIKGRTSQPYDNEDGKVSVYFNISNVSSLIPISYSGSPYMIVFYAAKNKDGGFSIFRTITKMHVKLIIIPEEAKAFFSNMNTLEPEIKNTGDWMGYFLAFVAPWLLLLIVLAIFWFFNRNI